MASCGAPWSRVRGESFLSLCCRLLTCRLTLRSDLNPNFYFPMGWRCSEFVSQKVKVTKSWTCMEAWQMRCDAALLPRIQRHPDRIHGHLHTVKYTTLLYPRRCRRHLSPVIPSDDQLDHWTIGPLNHWHRWRLDRPDEAGPFEIQIHRSPVVVHHHTRRS